MFADIFNVDRINTAVLHMDFVDRLVLLSERGRTQKLYCEKVRNHHNQLVLFAVFSQKFLYFAGSLSDIGRQLTNLFAAHEMTHFLDSVAVDRPFQVSLFQKLKISLLVLGRIVFDKPKLAFSLNFQEIELWVFLFFEFDAFTYF